VIWARDGRRLVTTNDENVPRVWRQVSRSTPVIMNGRARSVPQVGWANQASIQGHAGLIRAVAWSPDGRRIVTASEDRTACVWDTHSGKRAAELKGHAGAVLAAEWSPDGQRVVTASLDGTARIWDADSGRELTSLKHPGPVRSAAWSPDGLRIATACDDCKAYIWTSDPDADRKGAGIGASPR
jgi:WD40 repeat protein